MFLKLNAIVVKICFSWTIWGLCANASHSEYAYWDCLYMFQNSSSRVVSLGHLWSFGTGEHPLLLYITWVGWNVWLWTWGCCRLSVIVFMVSCLQFVGCYTNDVNKVLIKGHRKNVMVRKQALNLLMHYIIWNWLVGMPKVWNCWSKNQSIFCLNIYLSPLQRRSTSDIYKWTWFPSNAPLHNFL